MRHLILLGTWTLLGALLVATGVYLVVPSRNLHGDPRAEHELASCVLPDDAEVQLYQGDSTAASASWFTVTHNPAGLEPERQIMYDRGAPALYDLVCDSMGVVIRTDSEPISLTAAQARSLREWPRDDGRSEAKRWAGGAALMLVGIGLIWFLRPRRGDD